jgi:uncharacterized membrane protein YjjP (DUF1212 family)
VSELLEQGHGEAEELILRLGEALAHFGMPSHRLEDRLMELTEYFGLEGSFFAVPTSLLIDLGEGPRHRVRLARIRPSSIDLGKLEALHELADELLAGELGPARATTRIREIMIAPKRYGAWIRWMACLVASCAATRFMGGGVNEMLLGTLAGAMLGTLSLLLGLRASWGKMIEPLGAMIVAFTAIVGSTLFVTVDVDKSLLGGLIVLVPGFSIAISVRELVSGHTAAGTIRMASALMTTLMLGFGVAFGYRLGVLVAGEPVSGAIVALPPWTAWALLPVAALNVALVFQVHPRELFSVVVTACLGYAALTSAADPLGQELAVFAAAFTVGIVGNLFARMRARPFGVARLPALLFLVPGGLGFVSIKRLFGGEALDAMASAGQVGLVATALVTGLMVADSVMTARREGPVEAV